VVLKVVVFLVVSALCLAVARSTLGMSGLRGAAVGAGAGFVLCTVSHFTHGWAQRAKGHAILAAVFGGTLSVFALMIGTVLLLSRYWPEAVQPAAITALFVYLSVRFLDVFRSSRLTSAGGDGGAGRGGAAR
jgi:phosphatidylglycerophosphate synthase